MHQLKPRRVVIVHGEEESSRALADTCRHVMRKTEAAEQSDAGKKGKDRVFIARNGETIDATTESFIYRLKLPESLVSQLEFSKGKDGLLAWVDGVVSFKEEADVEMDLQQKEEEKENQDDGDAKEKKKVPSLLPNTGVSSGHNAVFVNELKLSDFKVVLSRNGISSEFVGGVLFCCGGKVALRRHDSGRVTIEGTVCREYYEVRSLLYEQYAII